MELVACSFLTLAPPPRTGNSTSDLAWLLDFFEAVLVETPGWKVPLADVCRVNDVVAYRPVAAVALDAAAAALPFSFCVNCGFQRAIYVSVAV